MHRRFVADADESDELPRPLCLELLGSRSLGRVALSRRALPTVVPVAYLLIGEKLWFTAPPAGRLLGEGQHPVVAFEVDEIDPHSFAGWSVVIVGVAQDVAPGHPDWSLLEAEGSALRRGPGSLVAGLTTDHISGRRFRPIRDITGS